MFTQTAMRLMELAACAADDRERDELEAAIDAELAREFDLLCIRDPEFTGAIPCTDREWAEHLDSVAPVVPDQLALS